jgi:rod shape-determining protein MreD
MTLRRLAIFSGASWLLVFLLGQVNHYLGAWALQIQFGGLLVTFAALRLDYRLGALAAFVSGLLLDASTPLPFGTQGILLMVAHAVIYRVRPRLPREELVVQVIVALVANVALWLALALINLTSSPAATEGWERAIGDLLVSQLILALIAPWFFAVQSRFLGWSGLNAPRRAH